MRCIAVAIVLGAVGAFGALAWIVGTGRRDPSRDPAWATLWPRPDGSVRSFGEVWDHPEPTDAAGRAA